MAQNRFRTYRFVLRVQLRIGKSTLCMLRCVVHGLVVHYYYDHIHVAALMTSCLWGLRLRVTMETNLFEHIILALSDSTRRVAKNLHKMYRITTWHYDDTHSINLKGD